jgi:isoleucyl-tRNA synthetase
MAPFTPFITEFMYQNLKLALPESQREDSVHYTLLPDVRDRSRQMFMFLAIV